MNHPKIEDIINLNKVIELDKRFTIIEEKMDKILNLLETDCKKMSNHIDFVENVYDNVKMPFYYVMDKVKCLVSTDNKILDDTNTIMNTSYSS